MSRRDWILLWYRPVGEFKRGERKMLQRTYKPKAYYSRKAALKAKGRFREDAAFIGFVYQRGRKPRKIVELQVFPEDYSGE